MKKIIICLLVAIALSNCEISVRQANAQISPNPKEQQFWQIPGTNGAGYYTNRITIDSMEYAVFVSSGTYNMGTTHVVNLTKDKLEVELLKRQLEKIQKSGKQN